MKEHFLKIKPEYFMPVYLGEKTFEVRFKDRPYSVGDFLWLQEYENGYYTGRRVKVVVTYILDNPDYCVKDYIIMGIKIIGGIL